MAKPGKNVIHYPSIALLFACCIAWIIFHNGWFPLTLALGIFFIGRIGIRYLTGHPTSGLKLIKNIALVLCFVLTALCCTFLRSETNYAYFLNHENPLEVLSQDRWTPLSKATSVDTKTSFNGSSARHEIVLIRRRQPSIWGKLLNRIILQEVHVFRFNPHNDFYLLADVTNDFTPLTVQEANERKASDFILNSSFYDPENHAIGEIIYLGKRYQKKTKSSGYFKVIHGIPHAGPASIFNNLPGEPAYSCQAHPSTLRDGQMFNYIENESLQVLWNQKTYRNLMGEMTNGDFVVVVSGNGGLVDVKEITQIAQLLGVNHATLFDAGSALQYRFTNPNYSMEFSAFNNSLDLGSFADRICVKLFRKNVIQRSPVYIGIKLNE
jgi:hypothetical protein